MTNRDPKPLPGFVQMARSFGITLASEDAQRLAHVIGHYVAQEREACAKVCEAQALLPECPERAAYCAEAIRARR